MWPLSTDGIPQGSHWAWSERLELTFLRTFLRTLRHTRRRVMLRRMFRVMLRHIGRNANACDRRQRAFHSGEADPCPRSNGRARVAFLGTEERHAACDGGCD